MVKGIAGYNETQSISYSGGELPKLEPGGYVLRIINVKVEESQWGAKLAFQFDIAEGNNKDFFKNLYSATPDDWGDKKWKGSYRMKFPVNEGDQTRYNKAVGFFKSQLEAFEKSNPGLKINAGGEWDEQMLKGKIVGAIFNEREWEMNGKSGFYTQCKRFISADDIRNGKYTIPKADMLKTKSTVAAASSSPFMAEVQAQAQAQTQTADLFISADGDGIPF